MGKTDICAGKRSRWIAFYGEWRGRARARKQTDRYRCRTNPTIFHSHRSWPWSAAVSHQTERSTVVVKPKRWQRRPRRRSSVKVKSALDMKKVPLEDAVLKLRIDPEGPSGSPVGITPRSHPIYPACSSRRIGGTVISKSSRGFKSAFSFYISLLPFLFLMAVVVVVVLSPSRKEYSTKWVVMAHSLPRSFTFPRVRALTFSLVRPHIEVGSSHRNRR